ncbi:MAG: adenylyl-sulfate kinase [Thermoplasmata archaeon]|nr:adenylyl-sulfate kinase [Thermoplasmata archaeon]
MSGTTSSSSAPSGTSIPVVAPEFSGFCLWMTGLPSSGKTTLGAAVQKRLQSSGYHVELLDGDEIRKGLSADLGFDRKSREAHAGRVAFLAKLLARNGVIPIVTLISPYKTSRASARATIGRFVEVYVATPLTVCEQRDVKGLYKKARAGEIKDMTGVDDPFEVPDAPDVTVRTIGESVDATTEYLLAELVRLRWL